MTAEEPRKTEAELADWTPLLDDLVRDRALAACADIAQALASPPPAWIPDFTAEPFRIARGLSLGTGSSSLALFFAYLDRTLDSPPFSGRQTERWLEYTGDGLAVAQLEPRFMNGLPGVLWALDHIASVTGKPLPGLPESLAAADEFLADLSIDAEEYDLWSGWVGFGVYALPRAAEPGAHRLLDVLLNRLLETVDPDPDSAPWVLRPELLKKPTKGSIRIPHTYLGVSHGVAGVVAFLAEAHRLGFGGGQLPAVCDRAWRWLVAQKSTDDQGTFWPNIIGTGIPAQRGLEKWCHGLPGIAAALLAASQKLGHHEMAEWSRARAREIVGYIKQRDPAVEISICHGSAGLGHMFNRIFQQTGEDFFADAARFFLEQTLDLQRPGYGVAGFSTVGNNSAGDYCDLFNPGLTVGAAGVGLVLLAAVGTQIPYWDRAILLS